MANKEFNIKRFLQDRPLSWSAMSSFEYDPEQWYQKYILKNDQRPSPEMLFGKKFADSCEARAPLAPVTLLDRMEYKLEFEFNEIPMVGFADTYNFTETGEYKTGVKAWDQKRVNEHGQIDFYALGNWIIHQIRPQECRFWLEWIPTKKVEKGNGAYRGFDYAIEFATKIPTVKHFDTKRSMKDILQFGNRIEITLKAMERYVQNHE